MSNLDKHFRDKLQNREFEFKDSFWQDAEEMIIARQERKRRRGAFWFIVGGLLMISMVGGAYFWNNLNVGKTHLEGNNEVNTALENSDVNIEENAQKTLKEQEVNEIQHIDNQFVVSEMKYLNNPKLNKIISQNLAQKSGSENIESDSGKETDSSAQPDENKATQNLVNSEPKTTENTPEFPTRTAVFISQIPRLKLNKLLFENTINGKEYDLPKERKFNFGLAGGAVILPNSGFSSNLSYKGGLSFGIPIADKWEMGAELSYFLFNNQFEPLGTTTKTTYDYGGDFDAYRLDVSDLHFLNLPIYAKYKFGFHALEGGLAIDYLLGAKGNLILENHKQSWERTGAENEIYEREASTAMTHFAQTGELNDVQFKTDELVNSGWLDDSDLTKFQAHILLGYQFRINSNYDLGIRAQYRLTDFHKTNTNFVKIDNPISIHLALKYRIW